MKLEKLAALQVKMAKMVILKDGFSKIRRIVGLDVAYSGEYAYAAATLFDFNKMKLIDAKVHKTKVLFPYIPGFLSFREARPMKKALTLLEKTYDIAIVNGHGIAHPRGLGIAAHLGVNLGLPTIGVAKGLLCGEVRNGSFRSKAPIFFEGKKVGYRVIPGKNRRPIFISPGNLVTLASSLKIVMACMKNHSLPEPLYMAHRASTEAKNRDRVE